MRHPSIIFSIGWLYNSDGSAIDTALGFGRLVYQPPVYLTRYEAIAMTASVTQKYASSTRSNISRCSSYTAQRPSPRCRTHLPPAAYSATIYTCGDARKYTVCQRSSYPIYVVNYIKWVITSRTDDRL